jgi:AcrR family transcriptional regulator
MNRAEKRAANRGRLLEAASRVFAEHGYHGAPVERIAEESGLSNGALYYNFVSKEELFLALLDEKMEQRLRDIDQVFGAGPGSDEPTEDRVAQAAGSRARKESDRLDWMLFFEFIAHAGRDAGFRSAFRRRLRRMRRTLARLIGSQDEPGANLALPPEQVAIALQALGYGLWAQRLIDPTEVPDDLFPKGAVALLRGLAEQ